MNDTDDNATFETYFLCLQNVNVSNQMIYCYFVCLRNHPAPFGGGPPISMALLLVKLAVFVPVTSVKMILAGWISLARLVIGIRKMIQPAVQVRDDVQYP